MNAAKLRAAARQTLTIANLRTVARYLWTAFAFALVWFVLLTPPRAAAIKTTDYFRIPVELLAVVLLAVLLPRRAGRRTVTVLGALFGLLMIFKILDLAFVDVVGRPFNPISDWSSFGPALGVARDSIGSTRTDVAVVVIILLALLTIVFVPLALLRLTSVAGAHRTVTMRVVGVLTVVWLTCATFGVHIANMPFASRAEVAVALDQVNTARATLRDRRVFAARLTRFDPYRTVPSSRLLSTLRGKDVLFVFVESYGQVAVQGTPFAKPDDTAIKADTRSLQAAGFGSRSGFLTSSTFGGMSWLAHATLQSGLWVDSQQRYGQATSSSRFTLSDAFRKAGWRTVSDVPSDTRPWSVGRSFYHYDKLYDANNVGYRGPTFGYEKMPDEYTFAHFDKRELRPHHRPVMAEIDLVSSHIPWAPLPHLVPWNKIGDGSILDPQPRESPSASVVWRHQSGVQRNYGISIRYSLASFVQFVRAAHDPNLVVVMLGDHQPWNEVSGSNPNHLVPISVISHDPSVLSRISSWHWTHGLLPNSHAPVWRMSAFRNRFFNAFDGGKP